MRLIDRIAFVFGYTPMVHSAPAPMTVATKKPAPITAMVVNQRVRETLTMAKDFYEKRGDRIVSVDLKNYLDSFEDALLMSATDGSSVETSKLFCQTTNL